MPTEDTKTETAEVVTPAFSVTRNEASLQFAMTKKSRGAEKYDPAKDPEGEGKYDLLKGQEYPAPIVTKENLMEVIKWMGLDVAVKRIGGQLNLWAQGLTEDVLAEFEGQFNAEKFQELAAQFSARGEKISDLISQLLDCTSRLETVDTDTEEGMKDMQSIVKEMKGIKEAIKSKKRKTKKDEEAAQQAA